MKKTVLAISVALSLAASLQPASAFFRGGFGGGYAHATFGGRDGVAHVSDAGGYWHGTAAGPDGIYHGSDQGGVYHGTAITPGGAPGQVNVYHGGGYPGGGYYHQPAVVNAYGAGCVGCGGGWGPGPGAVAAGVAAGAVVGAAAASAARPWPVGVTYGYLPGGCAQVFVGGVSYYQCGAGWLRPAYGANGVIYEVVPAP